MKAKNPGIVLWVCLSIALLGAAATAAAAEPLTVASPDGNLTLAFELKANPQPYLPGERAYYRVAWKGAPILNDSPLGLDFIGARPMDRDFEIVATGRKSNDTTWENPFGSKRIVPDKYNELIVSLREKQAPGRRVDIVFRAYDEGVALRYIVPKQGALEKFALASEDTGFYFAREAYGFALNMGRFNTHNEGEYVRTPLDQIKSSAIINLPLLVDMPGGPWAALIEADLDDYAGMYVGGVTGIPGALTTKLSMPPRKEYLARNMTTAERAANEQPVVGATPLKTPWRALMVAPTPGRLIETNYFILNLNPPCAIPDPSWIKPGKSAWDWWSGSYAKNVPFEPGMNTATMKHYVDFAGAHGIEYMLIDAGWYPGTADTATDRITEYIPEVNIPEIIAHAKSKGVRILLWVEFRPLDKQLDAALAQYEKWGVAGIKVDYMNRDDQDMVNMTNKWIRKCAEHHLTIDLHGAYKPTGIERTYPNVQTREAVMGMEYNKWSERVTPEFQVMIPFTRMLVGPMDFTPGSFHNAAKGKFEIKDPEPLSQGTRANQLAMYVVYDSPLVMLADYPGAYENQPGLEFIEKVPTVWDETRVLAGEPGQYITTLRKKGNAWYLGSMTNWDARDFEIPLSFLGKGRYEARIFADGPNAATDGTSLSVVVKKVKAGDKLPVHLAPGGGLAVILTPVK